MEESDSVFIRIYKYFNILSPGLYFTISDGLLIFYLYKFVKKYQKVKVTLKCKPFLFS